MKVRSSLHALWLLVLTLASVSALGAPKAELWPRWTARNPASTLSIDHSRWSALLERYVSRAPDGVNRFDYAGVTAGDRALLARYISDLESAAISRYSADAQLAYWINLYNALTVRVVLDHFPVRSIRDIDISPGLFANGPWGKKLATVEGERVSLDDIEHRILRPIWRDPRIHYAVNCAALGCPNLQPVAFEPETIETQLERAAREFVNHPRAVAVSRASLIVSSIYVWFEDDFGGRDEAVIEHLRRYAAPSLSEQLSRVGSISDHRYDWSLNTL